MGVISAPTGALYSEKFPILSPYHFRRPKAPPAMIHVCAPAVIKPQFQKEYLAILEELAPRVRREPGCLRYTPCVEEGIEGTTVTMIETWESREALESHLAGENIAWFRQKIQGMREKSSCHIYTPLVP